MQTAIAVRDTIFVIADVLVTMAVYVVTMIVLASVRSATSAAPLGRA